MTLFAQLVLAGLMSGAVYALLAVVFLGAAQVTHMWRLQRA